MFEAIMLTLLHTCSQSVHVMQHALLDQTIYVHKAIAFARRIIDYDLTYLKNGGALRLSGQQVCVATEHACSKDVVGPLIEIRTVC